MCTLFKPRVGRRIFLITFSPTFFIISDFSKILGSPSYSLSVIFYDWSWKPPLANLNYFRLSSGHFGVAPEGFSLSIFAHHAKLMHISSSTIFTGYCDRNLKEANIGLNVSPRFLSNLFCELNTTIYIARVRNTAQRTPWIFYHDPKYLVVTALFSRRLSE